MLIPLVQAMPWHWSVVWIGCAVVQQISDEFGRGRNVHATQAGSQEQAAQQALADEIVVLVDRTCCSSITPPAIAVKTAGSGPWSQRAVHGAGAGGGCGCGCALMAPANPGSCVVETAGPVLMWHSLPLLPQP